MIIGLSGKIASGKTQTSELLLERLYGYQRIAFGDILKRETADVFGIPLEQCYSQDGKATLWPVVTVHNRAMDLRRPQLAEAILAKFGGQAGVTVRELLQFYGTDVCRAADRDYWIDGMRTMLEDIPDQNVIVDDVRFHNELDLIIELGGLAVRLEPFTGWTPGPYANHPSETTLDNCLQWDLVFKPAYGRQHLEAVADAIVKALEFKEAMQGILSRDNVNVCTRCTVRP